jgi:RNA recognition motif-containing protein
MALAKNIPCSCKKVEVIDLLKHFGFMERSNFFYLPTRHGKILGYAFIGFQDAEVAEQFRKTMTGYQMPQKKSTKVIDVLPANIQGLSNNWEHFKNTTVMQSHAGPVFGKCQDASACI